MPRCGVKRMLNTFKTMFTLKNAYMKNRILYTLKSLPIIKRIFPDKLYGVSWVRTLANILSGIVEFFSAFLGKLLYILLIFFSAFGADAPKGDSFSHMLIFLTVAGAILNTRVFNPTKDKYYAIVLMRMDARSYALTDYFYFMAKMLLGFLVFSVIFGRLAGAQLLTCLLIPIFVIESKLCYAAFSLWQSKKTMKTLNENAPTKLLWVIVGLLCLVSALPLYADIALPQWVLWALSAIMAIPSVLSFRYILKFDSYRQVYKELLKPGNVALGTTAAAQGAAQQLQMQKKLSMDPSQTSSKDGYRYFNEIFMKRHAKLLTNSAKKFAIGSAVCFAVVVAIIFIFPEARPKVNEMMMTYLPYFLFIMYLINRGKVITQAMFMNCDHSMLTYRFYRQPKAIVTLFVERLKYIVLINLIPAVVIAAALPALLFLTGGTAEPLNYAVLFVSIIVMSVFFSVHNIVLYYLLQPYNINLESKSGGYYIANMATYFICYYAIFEKVPTLTFGTALIVFCVIYIVAAVILAYRLAPKTFKLRT